MTPAQAHQVARDAAAALPAPKSWVTVPQQVDKLGPYNAGANEPRFQEGKGDASPAGSTRVADCLSGTDPECQAIQVLRQGRSNPGSLVPPGSPQLTGRNLVVGDPAGTTGVDPAAVAQVVNNVQCTTITTTTPEVRELNTCDATVPNVADTCFIDAVVEVDPDWVYRCLYRTASNEDSICSVGQVVVVDKTTTYRCVEQLRTMNASTCTVGRVVEVRADTQYQCLVRTRMVGDASCSVGQVVVLDPNYRYRCTANPNAVTTNTCNRTLDANCPITCGPNQVSWQGVPIGVQIIGPGVVQVSPGVWKTRFEVSWGPYWGPGTDYFSMELVISGTMSTSSVLFASPGYGVRLDGTMLFSSQTNSNILRLGVNRFETYVRSLPLVLTEDAGLWIELDGAFCVQQPCIDTWTTTCGPYIDRL
jgi:hypothetical protein